MWKKLALNFITKLIDSWINSPKVFFNNEEVIVIHKKIRFKVLDERDVVVDEVYRSRLV